MSGILVDLHYKLSVARWALPRQLLVARHIKVVFPGRRFGKPCLSRQKLYVPVGMVVCISLLHEYLCV